MATEIRLQAINLSCIRQHNLLFSNISFQLQAGEFLLVEGPNGSGKSSLLRLLTGLATPHTGDICWHQNSIQHLRAEYWQDLHYIGHANGLKLGLTVTENLCLTEYLHTSAQIDAAHIASILELLQLNTVKNTPAKYLSAGQKRRLALAKLFLIPKTLWILDEPVTSLDAATQTLFLASLEKHLQQGGIAIISSHQPISFNHIKPKILRFESAC